MDENKESDVSVRLNGHMHEIGSLKHRMDGIEKKQESIDALAVSVRELAVDMRYMLEEQKEQGARLKKLEGEPAADAKYFRRTAFASAITAVVGALVGALVAVVL